ncbi:two-component system, HptB-dependent secretion and biofilm response regulator [Gammaproteobacteria bacterium]
MKILVVDDTSTILDVISDYCKRWGHHVITASDGARALECCRAESPDLILMDVVMPIMDGFEATSKIRKLMGRNWVPIILLTALDRDQDLVKGIESGADDYLTKPINFTVLREKVRVMERISNIQGQLSESLKRLQDYRDRAEEESRLAAHVMGRILGFRQINDSLVTYRVLPAVHFSGDLVACAYTPKGELHVVLADATGHGLVAALNVIPIAEIFYDMTARGSPIANIAIEMNHKIRKLMPRERFVAAVLLSVDRERETIHVWNGGCPTALFLGKNGRTLKNFNSSHLPLGVLPEKDFDSNFESYSYSSSGQFLTYSDGLLEAENPHGVPFGFASLIKILPETKETERADRILSALRRHLGNAPQLDDVSLVIVKCDTTHQST